MKIDFSPRALGLLSISLLVSFSALHATAEDWIHLTPPEGTSNGKTIIFVTGDDEYKSETSMPMMAHILAERHGFECKVLFAINKQRGVIDTNQRDHIPGMEALEDADLMVIYTRFRTLVDEQMQMIEDYLATGGPVIGLRTATHAFDFRKSPESPFAKYSFHHLGEDYAGGFGRQVLGETWIRHWGHHGKQSSRGRFAPGQENHPILRGISDGEIWGPTDVYEVTLPMPEGCVPVLLGEVCETMKPDSGPAPAPGPEAKGRAAIDKNEPMMPVTWTTQRDVGVKGRVVCSTIGGAMAGKDDWANEGMRRLFVNACFWTLNMESQLPAKADVRPVLDPNPFRRGVKPQEALKQGLAARKERQDANRNPTFLFYGNATVERLLEHGVMEARLHLATPERTIKVRSLAWTGDEVGNRMRLEGYAKHMKNLLAEWPANIIVLGYGFGESFAGEAGLAQFKVDYTSHLRQLAKIHPAAKVVLLSPTHVEAEGADVEPYATAISELAAAHGATVIDLLTPTRDQPELFRDTISLNDRGNAVIGETIAKALLEVIEAQAATDVDPNHLRELAKAVRAKHARVAEVVRPKNAVVYFGVRGRPNEYAEEMPRYHEMIRLSEAVVHKMAAAPSLAFADMPVPSLEPMGEGRGRDDGDRTGIIKAVKANEAEFKVADGYKVNLFASEEMFPELRNPVQIAVDARGRLWVVTMPSFPHTVPGLSPEDKVLIFEDSDRDGVADKVTTFADGLDALDGVAFHREGVIISEQPNLYIMQDTNGDDVADTRRELLRGIDVTDSHHGGMIATDPHGDIIFSDGVFHRSQFETPFGVHRGIDASTYRLDPVTGRIETEWQHTTPNPWNVTFDKWGNTFQMYGDGDNYDGAALIWTPLGAYQPYAYGRITSYGKGSGNASISSPNFPDRYQQGMASASLLGRYAVNLTTFKFDEGMVKQEGYETIMSSPNAAFRPADLEFGMDGSLYVSDFCSPIIGHAQHPMRDPHWDHDYGRIWRIVHTEKPLVTDWPTIEGATPAALCGLLTHPQDLVRHHARIELRKHGADGLAAVDAWIAEMDPSTETYEPAALEALFVCEGLGELRPALLTHLLTSSDVMFRGSAVRTLRLQADRMKMEDVTRILKSVVNDPHPRVQIEVIDAVAHLRPEHPAIEEVLTTLEPRNKHVSRSLETLSVGTEPVKPRSIPVLDVDPASKLIHWEYEDPEEPGTTKALVADARSKLPPFGRFRSFVHSDAAKPAIIALNHKTVTVNLNGSMVFTQDSFWSGEQQINVQLQEGLNTIEVTLKRGRRGKALPPVYVYNPVGEALKGTRYPNDAATMNTFLKTYATIKEERGNVLVVQAAAGLQFAPKTLEVIAGSKVTLQFENPDITMHNWVLIAPGTTAEVGDLANNLAASPKGMEMGYLPESEHILAASELLGPKGQQTFEFVAPTTPGVYPYLCTFPGHWAIMKGEMNVVSKGKTSKTGKTDETSPSAAPSANPTQASLAKPQGQMVFETSDSPKGFTRLAPPKVDGHGGHKMTANLKTNNDPIHTLTDGKLEKAFGPVFANGIKNGAYRMDLGEAKPVKAITSWAHNKARIRGAQNVRIYGSTHPSDPGWNVDNTKRFTPLGGVNTDGQTIKAFTALSLRSENDKPIGTFRWIVWQVVPVSEREENTAFQEFAVEIDN